MIPISLRIAEGTTNGTIHSYPLTIFEFPLFIDTHMLSKPVRATGCLKTIYPSL
jgi:hypothetical protein